MKLIVFGGTGRTGTSFVLQALEAGHRVTVFARSREKAMLLGTHQNLSTIVGHLGDLDQVSRAMAGRDAVVSALGVSRTLHHDAAVILGVRNILDAMQSTAVERVVYLSAFLAFSEKHQFSFIASNVLRRVLHNEILDHEAKEMLIRNSGRTHVIVRAARLTDQPLTRQYVHDEALRLGRFLPSIGRADTAHFMLQQLGETPYLNKAAIVSSKR